jgi:Leucine-rich repeat (LRR) protein
VWVWCVYVRVCMCVRVCVCTRAMCDWGVCTFLCLGYMHSCTWEHVHSCTLPCTACLNTSSPTRYPTGRVSLHLSQLRASERKDLRALMGKFQQTITELDLSHNNLHRLDFLQDLHSLKSLVADNNILFSTSPLPRLPQLTTLTVNANRILDLRSFIANVADCFPNLSYLSMLKNPADPYFKGSHHYFNFRVYVLSQLKQLKQLDATPVTPEEREHAKWIDEIEG